MAQRGGGRLGDVKGGNALADLLKAMRSTAPTKPTPASAEDLAAASRRRARIAPPATEQGRRAIASVKTKAKKEIIKMSAADVQKAYEQAGLGQAASAPAAADPASGPSNDFGAAAGRDPQRTKVGIDHRLLRLEFPRDNWGLSADQRRLD